MELYHVLNRGVEKRDIFLDNRDRARFVHDLYEFNSPSPAGNAYRRFPMMDIGSPSWEPQQKERKTLVDIHAWCIMKNHYHLLISENTEKGLSKFIQKLNIGYAKYFNERYRRSGTLFQGKTKRILIERDAHFLHMAHYVHLNPLDFKADWREWRLKKISRSNDVMEYLFGYRWSSFLDFCGQKNFPSVIRRGIYSEVYPDYKRELTQYVYEIDVAAISSYTLE